MRFLVMLLMLSSLSFAADSSRKAITPAPTVNARSDEEVMRIEGERRFHANCGRCHAAPQKYSPRVMATVVRHMRVRATITDEDMRFILHYLTQ